MWRATEQAGAGQLAAALFKKGAAERVIIAAMPRLRAAMHLDTVFTFADRDVVTLYPEIMNQVHAISLRPSDKPVGIEASRSGFQGSRRVRPWRHLPRH